MDTTFSQLEKIESRSALDPQNLGDPEFKKDYGLQYAYLAGAMYKGIASADLVIAMGKAGMMGYLGTGGMKLNIIEENIQKIKNALTNGEAFGMNLLCNLIKPALEIETVELYMKHGIKNVEAAAYTQLTEALVYFRLKGLIQNPDGTIICQHKINAKISRPEVAAHFLAPAPKKIVNQLLQSGKITTQQAELSKKVPMADDLTVEADSGGHTDGGILTALFPTIARQRDDAMNEHKYQKRIRVGAAGGLGNPEGIAAAFMMGADYVLTGSINQCTVEAGQSDAAKDMLQTLNVQDTEMAPAGDMFEIGAKVQVLKKGVFFPARANKLYELYQRYSSLDEIDPTTKSQIETKYFKKTFAEVWNETKDYYQKNAPEVLAKAEASPKQKMALIFRWYFIHSTRVAMKGDLNSKVDFQIHTGPAMGAFNQYVKGTNLEDWRNRHVDQIALLLLNDTVKILKERFQKMGL